MPKPGISNDYLNRIEDHIAAIIVGRYALMDIEAMIVASLRHNQTPQHEQERILKLLSEVRRAVDLGHEYAKKERGRG